MKGIILAGGTGSRLYPLSKAVNKHLLPVGRYPMIYYPIYKLKQAGISDILIITGKEHAGTIISLLGSGSEMGLKFTYRIQDQAGGIAQALSLAEGFTGNDVFVVILGDNIFEDSLCGFLKSFNEERQTAKVLLKRVGDPQRFGIAELADDGKTILSIEEKPEKPKSDYCVTGIYIYRRGVFDIIRDIKPSGRGELEISDVNQEYTKRGLLSFNVLNGWWTDAGTIESLACANRLAEGFSMDLTAAVQYEKDQTAQPDID